MKFKFINFLIVGAIFETKITISRPYVDAFYKLEEIDNLRRKCLIVQSKMENALALKGLDKLIRYCNKAAEEKLGLYMACD